MLTGAKCDLLLAVPRYSICMYNASTHLLELSEIKANKYYEIDVSYCVGTMFN
jgi:hypothetical protein